MLGNLYSSMYAVVRDLEAEWKTAVVKQKVTAETAAKLDLLSDDLLHKIKELHRIHDEVTKVQNTLQYLTAFGFEASEVLASFQDRTADIATKIGPDGKNLDWSPTFVKNLLLVVPPAVLAEAINSIKSEDWRDIIALRVVDR